MLFVTIEINFYVCCRINKLLKSITLKKFKIVHVYFSISISFKNYIDYSMSTDKKTEICHMSKMNEDNLK